MACRIDDYIRHTQFISGETRENLRVRAIGAGCAVWVAAAGSRKAWRASERTSDEG